MKFRILKDIKEVMRKAASIGASGKNSSAIGRLVARTEELADRIAAKAPEAAEDMREHAKELKEGVDALKAQYDVIRNDGDQLREEVNILKDMFSREGDALKDILKQEKPTPKRGRGKKGGK
jgi:methyl-accepting chemotaxis protein